MIKEAFLKPNFHGEYSRMDYFLLTLVQMGLMILGGVVVGFSMGFLEQVTGGAQVLGIIAAVLAVIGIFWLIYVSVTILVKRFRHMGMTDNSTLTIATIGFFVINQFIPFMILIPLFWPGVKKEIVRAQ